MLNTEDGEATASLSLERLRNLEKVCGGGKQSGEKCATMKMRDVFPPAHPLPPRNNRSITIIHFWN